MKYCIKIYISCLLFLQTFDPTRMLSPVNRRRQELTNILVGTLMWIILLPVAILPIFLPLTMYRLLVHFLAKLFRPDLIPVTNPIENMYSIAPTHRNGDVGANVVHVWKINGRLNIIEFRDHFYNTFFATEQLRETYKNLFCYFVEWMGYCFKKPVSTINLEEQIQEEEWTLAEYQNLETFLGKWMNKNDFGFGNPAWKILIIHVNSSVNVKIDHQQDQSETILLMKIEHGLADGYSKIDLTDKLTGNKSPYMVEDKISSFGSKIKRALAAPKLYFDLHQRWKAANDFPNFSKSEIDLETNRRISFTAIDLEALKKIRRQTNAHFSVIVGMLQVGAFARYLLKTGRVKSEDELQDTMNITTTIGLPRHPIIAERGLANHFGITEWKVPILTTKSGRQRILEAEEDFSEVHANGSDRIFSDFVGPMIWPLPTKFRMLMTKHMVEKNSVPAANHLSCLILSPHPYKLLGNSVQQIYEVMSTKHISPWIKMFVITMTVGDKLYLSVSTTSSIFTCQADVNWFTQVILQEELDNLVASCGEKFHENKTN